MLRSTIVVSCALLIAASPAAAAAPAPAADPDSAVLRIATRELADAALEDLILRSLAARGVDTRNATIDFGGMSATSAVAADADLAIERLTFQETTRRFVAVVVATVSGAKPQRLTAMGRVQQDIQIPVPSRPLQVGRAITAADLEWAPVGNRRLPGNAVYDPGDLIGQTPRRGLPRGAPVAMADLKRPALVTKGSVVTMVLSVAQMRLTVRGQALEDGAVGDTIRVSNMQSRSVVTGTVLPDGQIAVGDVSAAPPARSRQE